MSNANSDDSANVANGDNGTDVGSDTFVANTSGGKHDREGREGSYGEGKECPYCKAPNAKFSISQMKKKRNKRKCTLCVGKMLNQTTQSSHTSQSSQIAQATTQPSTPLNKASLSPSPLSTSPNKSESDGVDASSGFDSTAVASNNTVAKAGGTESQKEVSAVSTTKGMTNVANVAKEAKRIKESKVLEGMQDETRENGENGESGETNEADHANENITKKIKVSTTETKTTNNSDKSEQRIKELGKTIDKIFTNKNASVEGDDGAVGRSNGDEGADGEEEEGNWSPMQMEVDDGADADQAGNDDDSGPAEKEDNKGSKSSKCSKNNKCSNLDDEHDTHDEHEDSPPRKRTKRNIRNIREKIRNAREKAMNHKRDESNDTNANNNHEHEDDNENQEVSLDALKHKIMGRKILSSYDVSHESCLFSNDDHGESKLLMDSSAFADGISISNHLRQDLTCAICHDQFYNPVSLLCGHSFCRMCLVWWSDQCGVRMDGNDNIGVNVVNHNGEVGGGGNGEGTSSGSGPFGTCPTCRTPIPPSQSTPSPSQYPFQINTALKACMNALFGPEMNQRRLAEDWQKRKAVSGEEGGKHDRGCEVVVRLVEEGEEELLEMLDYPSGISVRSSVNGLKGIKMIKEEKNGWIPIYASSNQPSQGNHYNQHHRGRGIRILIRRSIILDHRDQRYQLSMGLTKLSYSQDCKPLLKGNSNSGQVGRDGKSGANGIIDIELCLLAMEEDEVDDSGFPTLIPEGSDDEALISTDDDHVHSCIEASAWVAILTEGKDTENSARKEKSFSIFGKPSNDTTGVSNQSKEANRVKEFPLSRGMIGRDGSVRFRVEINQILRNTSRDYLSRGVSDNGGNSRRSDNWNQRLELVKLKFCHVDTGAVLELRPPFNAYDNSHACFREHNDEHNEHSDNDEVQFGERKNHKSSKSKYFMGDDEEHEEHDENSKNEYEYDEFLVGDHEVEEENQWSDDDDVEEEGGENDDNDVCHICKHGGDLIICDGGDAGGGCGNAFHIKCIHRSEIPPGDWICKSCACGVGIEVGIEGHEYKGTDAGEVDGTDEMQMSNSSLSDMQNKASALENEETDDDDEIVPARNRKRPTQNMLEAGSEDEFELEDVNDIAANKVEMDVDIEKPTEDGDEMGDNNAHAKTDSAKDDDTDDEIVPARNSKRTSKNVLESDSEDDS